MSWETGMPPPEQMSPEEYRETVRADREAAINARNAEQAESLDPVQERARASGLVHGKQFQVATRYGPMMVAIDLRRPAEYENFVRAIEMVESPEDGYQPAFTLEDSIKILMGEIVPKKEDPAQNREDPLEFAALPSKRSSKSP
jgi:hypothetical protein